MIEIKSKSPQLQEELIDEGTRRRFIITEYKSLCDRMEQNLRNKYPHADTLQIECLLIESLVGDSTHYMKNAYEKETILKSYDCPSTPNKGATKEIPITIAEFSKTYDWPNYNAIRKMIVDREKNGLEGAFIKFKGRRLVLPKTLFRLIKLNGKGKVRRDKQQKSYFARMYKKWMG